jgi:hypothetical protein
MSRRDTLVVVAVGAVVGAWAMLAIPARATYGARTTADEPQYLLSALSLAEDHDLWIDDEIAAQDYRPFHEAPLPVQTERRDDGRAISPHDPLLPAILAVPMGVGGWEAAKATLAVLAGVLASLLTWIAVRRLEVPLGVAALTVLAFGLAAPLSAYGTQVYPELPAALAVAVAIAGLTHPKFGERTPKTGRFSPNLVVVGAAIVVLPWLGVKYLPVAAVLAVLGVARLRRPDALRLVAGLGVAGAAYIVGHRLLYGGWTVYASGDHFAGGEMTVVGNSPNYLGRTRRLAGLLLDREFGLAAWMPGYLLMVPALVALVRRRPAGWPVLVAPLAAGWATATWVALTMHGWWWPGRQTVVVLPCVVLAVAWWAGQVRAMRPLVGLAGVLGAVSWLWVVVEARRGDLTLIVDFMRTDNPIYRAWHAVLPDYAHPGTRDWLLQAAWLATLALAAAVPSISLAREENTTRRATHVPA